MSVANLLNDLVHGNFTSAKARVEDWWSGLSPSLQAFIKKAETVEGKILQSEVQVAAKDVLANPFSSASYLKAVADVGTSLLAQNIVLAKADIFAALNAEVSSQATAAGITLPTNAA